MTKPTYSWDFPRVKICLSCGEQKEIKKFHISRTKCYNKRTNSMKVYEYVSKSCMACMNKRKFYNKERA